MFARFPFLAGLSFAAMGAAMPLAMPSSDYGVLDDLMPTRRQKRGKGQGNRRGKGIRSKHRSRPNMNHISKRVRRKHRRARAA